jgi:hypothetical protein
MRHREARIRTTRGCNWSVFGDPGASHNLAVGGMLPAAMSFSSPADSRVRAGRDPRRVGGATICRWRRPSIGHFLAAIGRQVFRTRDRTRSVSPKPESRGRRAGAAHASERAMKALDAPRRRAGERLDSLAKSKRSRIKSAEQRGGFRKSASRDGPPEGLRGRPDE